MSLYYTSYRKYYIGMESVAGRILQEVEWGNMNWTELAQDREKWRTLLSTVMNLPVQ